MDRASPWSARRNENPRAEPADLAVVEYCREQELVAASEQISVVEYDASRLATELQCRSQALDQ